MSFYSEKDNPPDPTRKRKLYHRHFADVKGRILDVGCSTGNFTQHDPARIVGIDIDRDGLEVAASRGLMCATADVIQGLPFPENSFAAVNCDSVLEHVLEPLRLLREVRRVLRPGGLMVVITPNIYRVKHRFWRDYSHVHPFSAESLHRLVYDAGFHDVLVRTYSLNYFKALARWTPGWKTGRQPVWWWLEDLVAAPFGDNLILRARN